MPKAASRARLWITVGVLLAAYFFLHSMTHGEPVVPHAPLRQLSLTVDRWSGQEQPLPAEIVKAVGVSDYTNRMYSQPATPPVLLYVGYYATQRTGDTMHSPKNCLPGSGWEPVFSGYAEIPLPSGQKIIVNDYVIQKELDKERVIYWYQGRGRVIASEYEGKFWMVTDAIARNRTDGALVRLVTSMADGEAPARARLVSFAQSLLPELDTIIPR